MKLRIGRIILFSILLISYFSANIAKRGDAAKEKQAVAWRIHNDLEYVSFDKVLYPFCQFLRKLAIDHGIGDLSVEDHTLAPRTHEPSDASSRKEVFFWGSGETLSLTHL